jgi:hypothetical protein
MCVNPSASRTAAGRWPGALDAYAKPEAVVSRISCLPPPRQASRLPPHWPGRVPRRRALARHVGEAATRGGMGGNMFPSLICFFACIPPAFACTR